jgi:hypothetical protein
LQKKAAQTSAPAAKPQDVPKPAEPSTAKDVPQ